MASIMTGTLNTPGTLFSRDRSGSFLIGNIAKYFLLSLLAIACFYPFIWMVSASLKTDADIINYPIQLITSTMTTQNYLRIWRRIPFLMLYRNSMIFSGSVVACGLFFGSLAGYAYARMNFKGRNLLFILVLSTMMIPFQVIMIPLFMELKWFGLMDTFAALILPRACGAFEVFMMRSFFVSLPRELEESARMDGCNEFRIYAQIMLPLCKPAFLSCGMFIFNGNWNDLLFPMLVTSDDKMRTLQAGIALLMGRDIAEYGMMMAGAAIAVMPILVIYLILQRYFIQGIVMTGIKG